MVILCFSSKISIWFFFILIISMMRHSVFPFISRLIILIYWSMDIIAVLKFKVFENSNIFVVSGLVCADCLFLWHTLKFPDSLYIYWIILVCILYTLNFVMWIWILFKSSGEYRFCFSSYFNMHLTQLSSGCKSLPTFCKLLVQCQFIFQNLSTVIVSICLLSCG